MTVRAGSGGPPNKICPRDPK